MSRAMVSVDGRVGVNMCFGEKWLSGHTMGHGVVAGSSTDALAFGEYTLTSSVTVCRRSAAAKTQKPTSKFPRCGTLRVAQEPAAAYCPRPAPFAPPFSSPFPFLPFALLLPLSFIVFASCFNPEQRPGRSRVLRFVFSASFAAFVFAALSFSFTFVAFAVALPCTVCCAGSRAGRVLRWRWLVRRLVFGGRRGRLCCGAYVRLRVCEGVDDCAREARRCREVFVALDWAFAERLVDGGMPSCVQYFLRLLVYKALDKLLWWQLECFRVSVGLLLLAAFSSLLVAFELCVNVL